MSTESATSRRTTDLLTGLGNYQAFSDAIEAQMATEDSTGFSLAVVDLDYFKQFNDDHGHEAGDRALQILAEHLSSSMADTDQVFRYGGEEFIILFPNTEKEQAFLRLEQARQAFDTPHKISDDLTLSFTFSTGLAAWPDDGSRAQEVIRKADGAMYRAKSTGRNKVCLAREEKMVTKTSHYAQEQLERLSKTAKDQGVGEAVILREALDDVLKKYDDRKFTG